MGDIIVWKRDGQLVQAFRWCVANRAYMPAYCLAKREIFSDISDAEIEREIKKSGWVGRIFKSTHPVAKLLPKFPDEATP